MIADMTRSRPFKIEQKIPYAADYNTRIAQAKEDKTDRKTTRDTKSATGHRSI